MPTPMKWYAEAARIWGNVDPDDAEAVTDWFVEGFKHLDKPTQTAVMRYLLTHDGPDHPVKPQVKCTKCNGFGYTKGGPNGPWEKLDCRTCKGRGRP